MSVDLSDPAIITAIGSIVDPVSPISWLSLSYHPSKEKTFVLVSTGFDPWVPQWQETISARATEPLFGYGVVAKGRPARDGGEKGVILVYLPEQVTGIRRARAVVHSRAFINTFPDYSAIITISDPSQISEDFVREQVNYYNMPVPTPTSSPAKPRSLAHLGAGAPPSSGPAGALGPAVNGGDQQLDSARRQRHRPIQPSSSSTRSMDRPLPPPPAEPLDLPDNPVMSGTPVATPPRTASPTLHAPRQETTPPPHTRTGQSGQNGQGHARKDSLGSRFAKVLPIFTKSGHSNSPPRSPGRSTFESLTTGFGTGKRGGGERSERDVTEMGQRLNCGWEGQRESPSGPVAQEYPAVQEQPRADTGAIRFGPDTPQDRSHHGQLASPVIVTQAQVVSQSSPPPLPPKDHHDMREASEPPAAYSSTSLPIPPPLNRLYTLGAVLPDPAPEPESLAIPTSSKSSVPFPLSPTASAALASARERQLSVESQMHEDFRRTEEERTRIRTNSGHRDARIIGTPTPTSTAAGYADTYEDDEEGLPYDRPSQSDSEDEPARVEVVRPNGKGQRDPQVDSTEAETPNPYGLSMLGPVETLYTIAEASHSALASQPPRSVTPAGPVEDRIPGAFPRSEQTHPDHNGGHGDPPVYSERDHHAHDRRVRDEGQNDAAADPSASTLLVMADNLHQSAGASKQQPGQGEVQFGTTHRGEAAQALLSHSEQEDDLERRQEEARALAVKEAEAEAQLQQREQAAQAEAAREEERRSLEAEEEERRRAFQAQAEAYAEEQERLRLQAVAETEAAAAAEREREAAAARRMEALSKLRTAKASGGVMLQGHVTVQTTKSVIWRRRHFQLLPAEIRLFKTETEPAPIQTIPLTTTMKVLQQYEESQVQGSFKLASGDPSGEDFFMFSDTADERELLLQGLSMALSD